MGRWAGKNKTKAGYGRVTLPPFRNGSRRFPQPTKSRILICEHRSHTGSDLTR